ncbi:MAG: hypothetical protein K2W96_06020 [Gemmataceae bacterium]|nr:hypothetical protein [Gemmataceae bacterium]
MSCTYPIRAGPDLADRAEMLLSALDLLRGKFKEAAARAVGVAAASWVADLVRRATGGRMRGDDLTETMDPEEEDDGWGWREPREPEPIPSSASSAWPWMLALALLLCMPSLRLAGPASLAAALSP